MSDHYEVVFSYFLLDGTPDHVLDTLRWHLGLLEERPEGADPEDLYGRLLLPDPDTYLSGREFAELSLQDGGWGLHSRNYWLDDDIGWVFELLELIAPYAANDGYGGFIRDINEVEPTVFAFAGGAFGLTRAWGNVQRWPITFA